MSWINLLSVTARLIDLHDSRHQLGSAQYIPTEDRVGLGDGVWLDIATNLLEYLHEHDIDSSNGWIQINEFINQVTEGGDYQEEDVLYVVSTLATPTNITFLSSSDSKSIKSTKNTALIERPRNKILDRCRLTDAGRQALQFSRQSNNWIYAQHDAKKILTAISAGDFSAIPRQVVTIEQSIKRFSQEIMRMLERPGEDEIWKEYKNKSIQYSKTIDEVSDAVIQSIELLQTSNIEEQFLVWMEQQKEVDISTDYIIKKLFDIIPLVENLRRKYANLIATIADNKRAVVGNIQFNKIALYLALNKPSSDNIENCFKALGPWETDTAFISPTDLIGTMRIINNSHNQKQMDYDKDDTPSLPEPIEAFIEKHKDIIIEEFNNGRPVSISNAIKTDLMSLANQTDLTSLVGLYTTPSWLEITDVNIAITFSKEKFNAEILDESTLFGNELLMFLMERKAV